MGDRAPCAVGYAADAAHRQITRIPRSRALSSTAACQAIMLRTSPDWDYVRWLRDAWDGALLRQGCRSTARRRRLTSGRGRGRCDLDVEPRRTAVRCRPCPRSKCPACHARGHHDLPLIFDSGVEGAVWTCAARHRFRAPISSCLAARGTMRLARSGHGRSGASGRDSAKGHGVQSRPARGAEAFGPAPDALRRGERRIRSQWLRLRIRMSDYANFIPVRTKC